MIIKLTRNQINILEVGVVTLWLFALTNLQLPSIVDSIIKLMGYVIVAILVVGRFERVAYFATRDIFLVLLTALAAFSFFWSVLPDQTMTQTKAILRNSFFASYFALRFSLKEQMRIFAIVLGLGAVLSLLVCLFLPSHGISYGLDGAAWKGIYGHKNFLARMMGLGAQTFLLLALYQKSFTKISWAGFILSIILLLLSQGKSSLLIFLINLVMIPMYKIVQKNYKIQIVIYSIGAIFCGLILLLIINNWETFIVDILGKNLTLNGRTFIWESIISKVLSTKFWGGYGYGAFWGSEDSFEAVRGTWGGEALQEDGGFHAHSGYIDLFSQLGIIGLTLFLLSFSFAFFNIIKLLISTKSLEIFWALQFLIFILLLNVNITQTIMTPHLFWILYTSISISAIVQNERSKKMSLIKKKQIQQSGSI